MATEIKVPDIGDFKDVPVIEIHVKPGDHVDADAPLVTLESDKATMEVPAPSAGTIEALKVKIGDRVSEGSVIVTMASSPSPLVGEGRGGVDGRPSALWSTPTPIPCPHA